MKKNKKNLHSLDHLNYCKQDNLYLTIALLFFTIALLIAGLVFQKINQKYAFISFLSCGILGFATLYVFCGYLKFKRLINKILNSLSDEEKNDVSFLMSIDYRDYLKKNYKETDENEDLDD